MSTWHPIYEQYKASCGTTVRFESIWEIYTSTAKKRIAKFLSTDGNLVSEEDLSTLTNAQFLQLMCNKKGHSTTALTETALREIKFIGAVTERANWVNHESSWEESLALCSVNGEITQKRLIVIYRESIPDKFFQTHMSQNRFDTWTQMHQHMLLQITKSAFIIPWHDDVQTRQKVKEKETPASDTSKKYKKADAPSVTDSPFDPLTFMVGKLTNVNPNFKKDFTLNPSKAMCTRCDELHRWLPPMCTNRKNKAGTELTDLSEEDITARTKLRYDAGFFFSKPFKPFFTSPSAQQSAAASASAIHKIGGKKAE